MSDLPPIAVTLTADTSDFTKGVNSVTKHIGEMEGAARKGGDGLGALKFAAVAAGAAVAAKSIVDFGKASIDAASDLGETSSKVEQIFGAAQAAQIQKWSDTAAGAFGQSKAQAMDAAASFAVFGKSAGLSGENLTGFSTQMTALASDLASFNNTSPEEAITAIGSALRGEAEPIRKYGVLMDDASMKQAIFEKTGKQVTGTLTPQQKVLAAQAIILKQTADAQGDFARTSDGLANSQRTLEAALGDMKAQVGQGLLPAITSLVQALAPIATSLAKPLGDVATALGGALKQAFDALAPILPTLATALGEIAKVLGSVLATAITTLVPILTPILEIFGELANRVGPMLQPILEKIGEVLGKVLEAVMPLLPPLMDLVFTILDAATPILMIVADLFLTLVNALSPIIGIVGSLLGPIGQLINVGFKALKPVLDPLMPLLTVLADLLGNVIARAIGVIVTAIGGMIIAWSKLAPFVLNNVITPVLGMFLTFAEGIVGAAATAFGWIPGLGDKLNGAKNAIHSFKENTTKAIGDAAKTIGTEGEKLGKGLVDQGVALMKDPSQVAAAKNAGMGVGLNMAQGMAAGIRSGQIPIQAAAAGTITAAERAAKKAAQIESPSKVFANIGQNLMDGLVEGMKANKQKVSDSMKEHLQSAFDHLNDVITQARDYGQSIKDTMFGWLSLGTAYDSFTERQKAAADTLAALTAYQKEIGTEATDAQKAKLAELQTAYQDAQTAAATGSQSIVDEFNTQAEKFGQFGDKLMTLLRLGLSKEALQQIMNMGAERGGEVADSYLNGNTRQLIDKTNSTLKSYENFTNTIGDSMATQFYAKGIAAAIKSLEGIIEELSPKGKKYKALINAVNALSESMKSTTYIDVVTRYSSTGAPAGGGGGGASGGAIGATEAEASPSTWQGAAASSSVAQNFSSQTLSNAQLLNQTAAAGGDVTSLGFTKADWAALAQLEAANNAAAGRALGGPVQAGRMYRVGENGPETFVSNVDGSIKPQAPQAGNVITVYASTNADAFDISREIAWQLKVGM